MDCFLHYLLCSQLMECNTVKESFKYTYLTSNVQADIKLSFMKNAHTNTKINTLFRNTLSMVLPLEELTYKTSPLHRVFRKHCYHRYHDKRYQSFS